MRSILIISLLTTLMFAQEYTKADRIKDMQDMAGAMANIEQGFFYNNVKLVQNGALSLSDAIRRVEPPLEEKEEKDPMTRYMNEKVKFTNKAVKDIDRRAKMIIERFGEGDTIQAIQAYTSIVKECMGCHTQFRKW